MIYWIQKGYELYNLTKNIMWFAIWRFQNCIFREGCNAKAFFKHVPEWIRGRKGNIIMGTANQIEQELMSYISDHKIRNTHSHHLPEQAMVDFDLDKLINNTYLQWQQVTPGTTAESRTAYLEKTRYKSYFDWLQKAIGELYGISEPITAQNWD